MLECSIEAPFIFGDGLGDLFFEGAFGVEGVTPGVEGGTDFSLDTGGPVDFGLSSGLLLFAFALRPLFFRSVLPISFFSLLVTPAVSEAAGAS